MIQKIKCFFRGHKWGKPVHVYGITALGIPMQITCECCFKEVNYLEIL